MSKQKKGNTFRLLLGPNENVDKIMGYLEMCFESKSSIEATALIALLGVGLIKVSREQGGNKSFYSFLGP